MSDRLFEEWRSTGTDERVKYQDWLEERVERVEALLADAQRENEVLRATIAEAWDAHAKAQHSVVVRDDTIKGMIALNVKLDDQLAERDERIRELEQEIDTHAGECHPQIESLEQQLKAAQERLAEAERLVNNVNRLYASGVWLKEREEYFAKHSPSPVPEVLPRPANDKLRQLYETPEFKKAWKEEKDKP